jgi:hypothetical protein
MPSFNGAFGAFLISAFSFSVIFMLFVLLPGATVLPVIVFTLEPAGLVALLFAAI